MWSASPRLARQVGPFRDRDGLNFPLVSDPDKSVLTAYGAYAEAELRRTVQGVIRSTFVIGRTVASENAMYNARPPSRRQTPSRPRHRVAADCRTPVLVCCMGTAKYTRSSG